MVEREEKSIVWSQVQRKSIELINGKPISIYENPPKATSLTEAILKNRGFDSLAQMYLEKNNPRKIPVDILREIVLVDSLDVDPVSKIKLVIYRVWAQDGHYSRVKEFFPETSIGLEQIQTTMSGRRAANGNKPLEEYVNEVMMDEGELGRNYNIIHNRANIINKLLPWTSGLSYIRKYELLTKIIKEVTDNSELKISKGTTEQIINVYEREVAGLEKGIRSEIRLEKRKSQKERVESGKHDPRLEEVLKFNKKGLNAKNTALETGYTLSTVYALLSALYYAGKATPRREKISSNKKYAEFVTTVKTIILESKAPITSNEIAELTNATIPSVEGAINLLRTLGIISKIDRKALARFKAGTEENVKKVEDALIKFQRENSRSTITLNQIRELSGLEVGNHALSKYIREVIRKNPELPRLYKDSLEIAKREIRKVLEVGEKPNYAEIVRKTGIHSRTVAKAHKIVLKEHVQVSQEQ